MQEILLAFIELSMMSTVTPRQAVGGSASLSLGQRRHEGGWDEMAVVSSGTGIWLEDHAATSCIERGVERDRVDARIAAAAAEEGFMSVGGLLADVPLADVPLGPQSRSALLRIFSLPEQEIRKLWRWNFEPHNSSPDWF